ncbi:MAG: YceI family protein [Alphaproteobacteria bacterium]|nr:YceI family protein [Alphaproteobacteria bacterium]
MSIVRLTALTLLLGTPAALAEDPPAGEEPAQPAVPAAPEPVAPPAPRTWTLTADNTTLYVQVYKDTEALGAGLAHDHVVLATRLDGAVTWSPADQSCNVEVKVPVAKLEPDLARMRAKVGLEGEMSDSTREDIRKNMLAADQLDASKHPFITFAASQCALAGDTLSVTGKLTVHGTAKTVTIPFKGFQADSPTLHGHARFEATHADFGMEPYSAMFGQIRNAQPLRFGLEVNATGG